MSILIERRLGTAPFWMPVERGWVDPGVPIRIVAAPTVADIRDHSGLAIVDSLLASPLLDSAVIVRDHGVAMDQISLLSLVTVARPDEVERAVVAIPGISLTGRALAEIVIPSFYGIEIAGWSDEYAEPGPEHALVTEDERALLPTASDEHYHEDLGRAWFLLTDTPFVSHICIASEELYTGKRAELREASRALELLTTAAGEQRRMLRRNLSRDHDIDRELVTTAIDGLQLGLSSEAVEGLVTLYHRCGVLRRTGPLDDRIVTLASG